MLVTYFGTVLQNCRFCSGWLYFKSALLSSFLYFNFFFFFFAYSLLFSVELVSMKVHLFVTYFGHYLYNEKPSKVTSASAAVATIMIPKDILW